MSTESETTDFATATQGRTFAFYGICGNQFKLDATVWEAIEDEADGYRSYLDAIERRDSDAIFFAAPLAQVRVEAYDEQVRYDENEGFRLVDVADGHVWLRVGTDWYNDYYPTFCFEYEPKAEVTPK